MSILIDFQTAKNVYDWEISVHGIWIDFFDPVDDDDDDDDDKEEEEEEEEEEEGGRGKISSAQNRILRKKARRNSFNATYLPEVCSEQGWTKQECLESLIRKSGFEGKITKQLLEKTTLTRYKSTKCSLSYQQYSDLVQKNSKKY